MISVEDIRTEATRLGFDACGFAPSGPVEEETARRFDEWIREGCQAGMQYMENHRALRMNPSELVENAATVISLAVNYYPPRLRDVSDPYISLYAYGEDYHKVLRRKMKQLWRFMQSHLPSDVTARLFVDSAPVLERYWAVKAGIGWIGRNRCLIIPGRGSFFFLCEIITTWQADRFDTPIPSRCGSCTRCIDHCPSHALTASHLDARRCFSYLTIENRDAIPQEQAAQLGKRLYGCDSCQLVCPWNRFRAATKEEAFYPTEEFLKMGEEAFRHLENEADFNRIFAGSAMKRAGLAGLKRTLYNIR